MLRIVVAEDDPLFLTTLVSLLRTEFNVVGTAATGGATLQLVSQLHPDVVVLDLEISRLSGIEVTRRMTDPPHPLAVVVFSLESDLDIVSAATEAGALGYVLKSRIAIDLVTAIKSAADGRRFVSPS